MEYSFAGNCLSFQANAMSIYNALGKAVYHRPSGVVPLIYPVEFTSNNEMVVKEPEQGEVTELEGVWKREGAQTIKSEEGKVSGVSVAGMLFWITVVVMLAVVVISLSVPGRITTRTRVITAGIAIVALAVLFLAKWTGGNDLGKIQGTWNVITASRPGRELPTDDLTKVAVIFKGDTLAFVDKNHQGRSETARFVLRPTPTPKELDFIPPTGLQEKPVLAIYELDGDNLTLCLGDPGSERPTAFVSQPKAGLFTLKRAKNE